MIKAAKQPPPMPKIKVEEDEDKVIDIPTSKGGPVNKVQNEPSGNCEKSIEMSTLDHTQKILINNNTQLPNNEEEKQSEMQS